ncbi:MAG: TIGR04255 family protein [Bacteroidales bacterium]
MFDFPKVEHKYFNKNFLKTVIFRIDFEENNKIFEKKKEITDLFSALLPRISDKETKGIQISFSNDQTPILQSVDNINTGKVIEMKSIDGQRILAINKSSLTYTIGGQSYSNSIDLKKELNLLIDFYKISEIKFLKRLAFRKINIIEFKISNNPSEILLQLISPDLLSNLAYFPKSNSIKQNIHSLIYQDGDYSLNIKYGLNIPPIQNIGIGQIIIDIDLFNTSKIETSETIKIADMINSEIFNIFNWAISENTKRLLNG